MMKTTGFLSVGFLVLASTTWSFSDFGEMRPGTPEFTVASLAASPAIEIEDPTPPEDPPTSPPRVALQAGHWLAAEAPDELARIRTNGTRGGGKAEWEVTLDIAERAALLLRAAGYEVDVLPATVPPRYEADLFISIHADGNNDSSASGFSIAAPRRDRTGRGTEVVEIIAESYREATSLRRRSVGVTRRMENYYAFNSQRYVHSIHPMTVAVILETGFLTNPSDRRIIVDDPDRSARGIADGVIRYLGPVDLPPSVVASQ